MTRTQTVILVALLAGLATVTPLLLPGAPESGRPPLAVPASYSPTPDDPAPSGPGGQTLNGVDFSGLSQDQVSVAMQILRETRCNCSCGMTLAECRVKDPNCSRSLTLSQGVVQDLKSGKDRAAAQSNLAAALAKLAAPPPAAQARPAEDSNKVYKIDITGSPSKGPKGAPVTIVEFSDYQ